MGHRVTIAEMRRAVEKATHGMLKPSKKALKQAADNFNRERAKQQ